MLDKIDDTGQAKAFRNGVKAPFGIGGYVCLISVSEHATSNLKLRGLLFRDAFDDILRGGPLSLDRAIRLIERRVFRLPPPFPMPCHCLSGGLPRDLIGVCRRLPEETTAPEAGAETLPAAALRLVAGGWWLPISAGGWPGPRRPRSRTADAVTTGWWRCSGGSRRIATWPAPMPRG
ncbi:hypothetical protein [Poseidonocella sp. HB161398]|uniref:hypothetical protein n=1 Tax=Poseidonocella sp. HB161398 TaxID=2320855 RepID=UPI00110973ED|nr:hypothetical protein [Poseidonocella sp. HB161398]